MAIPFLSNINLNKNQALNLVLHNATSNISTPSTGQVYFNTSSSLAFIYNGSAWVQLGKSDEQIQDIVGAMLTGGTHSSNVTVTYDDTDGFIDLSVDSVTGTGAANKLAIWSSSSALTNDTNLHWDTSNNRLGIGTATPDYTLDVAGNVGVDEYIYHNGDTDTHLRFTNNIARLKGGNGPSVQADANKIAIGLSEFDLDGDVRIGDTAGINSGTHLEIAGGSTLEVKTPASYVYFKTGGTHSYFTGNLGIDVTSPTQKLDVSGNIKMTETAATSDTDKFIVSDSGVLKYRTGSQVRSDIGAGTGNGTVTSVNLTAGNLIDVSGGPVTSSGSITVNVDLSELTDMTQTMLSTDELVVLDGGSQKRKAASEIGLSIFNNNLSNIANSALANSSITIGNSTISLGGTDTTLTGLTDIDLTSGNKTIFDGVGSNNLTIGAGGTTVIIPGDLQVTGTTTTNNVETISTSNGVVFEGSVADANELTLLAGSLTADRTVTLPDATGTVALTSDLPTVNNGTLTVQGTGALGGSGTFTANQSGNTTISISHDDTSSQSSVNNSGLSVIQDVTLDTYGHTTGLTSVNLTSGIDGRVTAREFSVSIGDGINTSYTVTHNLDTRDVIVQLYDVSSYETVYADVTRATVDTITIAFASAPNSSDIRVLITQIG
jgi:hypothetical protein